MSTSFYESISLINRFSALLSSPARTRNASGRSITRLLIDSGIFSAIKSSSSGSASRASASLRMVSSLGYPAKSSLPFSILLR